MFAKPPPWGRFWFDTLLIMQAVILAAGRGTRMVELTSAVPKPMLEVAGRPLLEYKLEALPEEVDEVVLIIGYLGHVIRSRFGARYDDKRISYVEQKAQSGTADALWSAKNILKDRFLVLNGDDIYPKEDIETVIAPGDVWRLLVQQKEDLGRSGSVELDQDGHVLAIVEGDHDAEKGIASTNMFLLDSRLFSQPMTLMREGHLEFGLPQTIIAAAKNIGVTIEPVYTTDWIEINTPTDLVHAGNVLKNRAKKA